MASLARYPLHTFLKATTLLHFPEWHPLMPPCGPLFRTQEYGGGVGYIVRSELFLNAYLRRHFWWHLNVLWLEDVDHPCHVILCQRDEVSVLLRIGARFRGRPALFLYAKVTVT